MEHIFLWPVREWINLIFSATSANFRPKMICSKFKLNDEGMTGSLYYTCHDPLDWSSVQLRFLLLFYFLESSFRCCFILVVLSVYHLILLLFPVNSWLGLCLVYYYFHYLEIIPPTVSYHILFIPWPISFVFLVHAVSYLFISHFTLSVCFLSCLISILLLFCFCF